jgi:segregation and condensation protein B
MLLALKDLFEDFEEAQQSLRILEALLFASPAPLNVEQLQAKLPPNAPLASLLARLQDEYATRGVHLVQVAGGYAFRTAQDLSYLLQKQSKEEKKLSRAALEVLAIIAYHQPVTRAEIEEVRGVSTSKGTLDVLLEADFVRLRGRRKTLGRPLTFGTTLQFLNHFTLDKISDLPGLEELKATGIIEGRLPHGFAIPAPNDSYELSADEEPLAQELDLSLIAQELDEESEDEIMPLVAK